MKARSSIWILVAIGLWSGPCSAADNHEELTLPGDITKIAEASRLTYQIGVLKDGISDETVKPAEVGNGFFVAETGGTITLKRYELKPEIRRVYDEAESLFQERKYKEAIERWREVLKLDDGCRFVNTMIGDGYYFLGDYEKAKEYLLRAIADNRIDYDAHWFLADTYRKLGDRDRAVDHLLRAHLLNRHHAQIMTQLKRLLEENGQEWLDWDFVPQYRLNKNGDVIEVTAKLAWVGYALAKAVWKYEPDYPGGHKTESVVLNPREEKEALLMYLSQAKGETRVHAIIEAGFFGEFSLYEIGIRKWPQTACLLPSPAADRIVEYLKRFHVAAREPPGNAGIATDRKPSSD